MSAETGTKASLMVIIVPPVVRRCPRVALQAAETTLESTRLGSFCAFRPLGEGESLARTFLSSWACHEFIVSSFRGGALCREVIDALTDL